MMQVVFVVLHKTELLQDLLTKLKKAGVSGGTIIDSQGMISYVFLKSASHNFISYFIQECLGILAARCASCNCMTYFYCAPLQSCRRLYQMGD